MAVDGRTDIYSLGAVMYEMLTFRKPFQSNDTDKLLHQIAYKAAPEPHLIQPDVPLALSHIVAKAMNKKPEKRYQHAEEMALDIKRYLMRTRRQNERSSKSLVVAEPRERMEEKEKDPASFSPLFWAGCSALVGGLLVLYWLWGGGHLSLP
jgi:serine/threonine protein kinase